MTFHWKKIMLGSLAAFALVVVLLLGSEVYYRASSLRALDQVEAQYSYGPEDADLTMVEFVKFTCPYCRDVHLTVMDAIAQDGNVRYVPRILPTTGLKDAQMAYAAGRQDLFKLAHGALLQDPRIMDEGGLMAIADTLGLDVEKLSKDMDDGEIIDQINKNIDLFYAINGKATPTFVIGGKIIYVPEGRMPNVEDFLKMFEEARK